MLSYIKNLLPRPIILIYGAILPLITSLYVFVDRSLNNTINTSEINYFSFADSTLGSIILEQSWQYWLTRAMDFVMWGAIGGIILLLFWVVSSSRIAVHNHKIQEEFVNFKVPRGSWHSHFATIALVKIIILFLIIYCLGITIFVALPAVIEAAAVLALNINMNSIINVLTSSVFIIFMQYLFVLGIKLFKNIHVDE